MKSSIVFLCALLFLAHPVYAGWSGPVPHDNTGAFDYTGGIMILPDGTTYTSSSGPVGGNSSLQQAFTVNGEIDGAVCGVNPLIVASPDGTVGVELCYNPTYGPEVHVFPTGMRFLWIGEVSPSGVADDGTGKAVCIKSDKTFGTCGDAVGAGGTCTCS